MAHDLADELRYIEGIRDVARYAHRRGDDLEALASDLAMRHLPREAVASDLAMLLWVVPRNDGRLDLLLVAEMRRWPWWSRLWVCLRVMWP